VSDRSPERRDTATPSPWLRRLSIGLAVVLGPELVANLISTVFANTPPGVWLAKHTTVLVAFLGLVVVALAVAYVADRRRRRHAQRPAAVTPAPAPAVVPEPLKLPEWDRFPTRIQGRDSESRRALELLRGRGVVAIVGPRDVGTSSVATVVVTRLLADDAVGGDDPVVWVDMRGNSATSPPGPREVAGRLLSTFDQDEPADATTPVLRDAAVRLVAAARQRSTVLVLDNVFTAEQVSWLTDEWPSDGGPPMLVIAGDERAAAAVRPDDVVTVGPLDQSAMRAILRHELGRSSWPVPSVRRDPVDVLLSRFRDQPGAVREIAWLVRVAGRRSAPVARLIDDTAIPGRGNEPLVALWQAVLPMLLERGLSPAARDLARALTVLPVTGLSRDALGAMLPAGDRGHPDPIQELADAQVIRESPPGRFRLPEEVRRALWLVEPQPVPDGVWTAVHALTGHYAARAGAWAAALRSPADARPATVWLHQEEPLLRALITDWRPDALPPESLVDDLAAIAAALDVWYTRELQSDGLVATGRGLRELASRSDRPELARLAALRTAAAHRIGTHLDLAEVAIGEAEPDDHTMDHPTGWALRARWHTERALIEFDRADQVRADGPAMAERLQAAENELRLALRLVPENDPAGRLCVLVDLAAVGLEQRRLETAQDFLGQAELMAGVAGDLSGAAHVVELQGVAAILGGNAPYAVTRWEEALGLYRDLGEEQGEARCLQHLGTVAVASPEIAGLLGTGHRSPVSPREAAAIAHDKLTRAKRLMAGQPDTTLVDHYLRIAEERLDRAGR
jgi:tetratricopeptide (TPR) repeat protein